MRERTEVVRFFGQSMGRSVSGIEYKLEQAYPSPEAGALVLELSTRGRTAAGRDYINRLVGGFQV